ncbi:hypothetical protein NSS79_34160 [Paenibacillus sp. FSL L8-0436]|uniref:hypothetical protein n=1 Tax=Paenibacillus sp. FSL L8-0436 TaxID=2954686 RepID=UPI0031589B2E
MSRITVVNVLNDPLEGFYRSEYPGVLVDANYAFYIDVEYATVVLERVRRASNGEYLTTGGPGAVGFDLPVDNVEFFDRITEMSAVELLSALVRRSKEGA